MPGIFGKTKSMIQMNSISYESLHIHKNEELHEKLDFDKPGFKMSLVHFDFQNKYPFHFDSKLLEFWIYGDPLIDNLTGEEAFTRTRELIESSYPDISKLSRVDGLFNIVLYDKTTEKLYLINDRNGLSHLFYGVFNNQLVWGSELSFFINKKLETTINKENIKDFLNLGYAIDDDTWFNEVKLLSPASYLEWDLKQSKLINKNAYWSHKKLKRNTISGSEKEIVSTLKQMFQNAVTKRIGKQERVGITLSGGLDSRLIFANIPFQEQKFTAITRGMKNAGDIDLAKQVVALRKDCQHIIKAINATNWINGRVDAVEVTSGQKNIFDMNAMSSLSIHKKFFDINLDGAGGDGIFTGGHLKYEGVSDLHSALKKTYFRDSLEDESESLNKVVEYYKTIDSDQHFYIYERIRRFVVFGSILGHDYGIVTRFPFLDHQLQDYFYQLDEKYNSNDLYYKMLLKYYPEYFINIDSLDSGTRLYGSSRLNFLAKAKNRLQEKFGYKKYIRNYHSYSQWIREENRDLIQKYILSEDLSIYNFLNFMDIKEITESFIETGKNAKLISKLLTISIFLENYNKVLG